MKTSALRVNRDIVLAMKSQQMKERQKKNPYAAVTALAQMQTPPRDVMNYVDDAERVTVFGQVTRTAHIYDPVASAIDMVREGADGIMFYTDHTVYANDLEDLFIVARSNKKIPVVYQNYIMNEYHVVSVRVADASGLVLYSSLLEPRLLRATATIAQRWRFTVFIQVSTAEELAAANALSPHVLCYGEPEATDALERAQELGALRAQVPYHTKLMLMHTLQTLDEVEAAVTNGATGIIVAPHLLRGDYARKLRLLTHEGQVPRL